MLSHLRRALVRGSAGEFSYAYCGKTPPPYSWTAEDYSALRWGAGELGTTPEELLKVFYIECKLNPADAHCEGSYPTAIGLNQITRVNAAAMKISEAERLSLLDMSAAEQMPYVVRSFLAARGGKPFSSPPDAVTLYQTNIAPSTVPNEVLYTEAKNPKAYYANRWLDKDNDGAITRSDLHRIMAEVMKATKYQQAVHELHTTSDPGGLLDWLLLGAALGGAYYAYKRWVPSSAPMLETA